MIRDKSKKSAITSLEKIQTIFTDSISKEINDSKLFVIEEYSGRAVQDEELAYGFFCHKLKLLLEKFIIVWARH
jgi:hypothetical protein